ncbi:hypothetical protein TTRE_0000977401 [Trichuris trichiura]|uniref:Uncharacterized protein n=1 Tax=Trichuris trichiura TaxID=36087 RepID=A0A077ZNN1_TRITR|nr:hypothetical protein TTRE_0000977401 [Trichuris trichiura]
MANESVNFGVNFGNQSNLVRTQVVVAKNVGEFTEYVSDWITINVMNADKANAQGFEPVASEKTSPTSLGDIETKTSLVATVRHIDGTDSCEGNNLPLKVN